MRDRLPMIFSTTALLVAMLGVTPLGEAAYNAVVPRNSVGTLQLQRNAVKAAKIAPNAIRAGHVLNGSLLVEDFKSGQLPQGPKGDKGEKGDRGEQGPTEAVSAVDGGTPAPTITNEANFLNDLASTFTTSRPGRLLLLKDFGASLSCPTAPSAAWWWLKLDGAVVPGSIRIVQPPPVTSLSISGVTAQSVPAGNHTLGVGAMCFAGSNAGGSVSSYSGGSVIVLG